MQVGFNLTLQCFRTVVSNEYSIDIHSSAPSPHSHTGGGLHSLIRSDSIIIPKTSEIHSIVRQFVHGSFKRSIDRVGGCYIVDMRRIISNFLISPTDNRCHCLQLRSFFIVNTCSYFTPFEDIFIGIVCYQANQLASYCLVTDIDGFAKEFKLNERVKILHDGITCWYLNNIIQQFIVFKLNYVY